MKIWSRKAVRLRQRSLWARNCIINLLLISIWTANIFAETDLTFLETCGLYVSLYQCNRATPISRFVATCGDARSVLTEWSRLRLWCSGWVHIPVVDPYACVIYVYTRIYNTQGRSPHTFPLYAPARVANTLPACHMEWCEVCSMWPKLNYLCAPTVGSWVGASRRMAARRA